MPLVTFLKRSIRAALRRSPRRLRALVPAPVARRVVARLGRTPQVAPRTPALSVVIPVYNVATYLPACLDSVLSQSLKNLEVIVVDDGSTDRSPEIIAEYAARDPRVRVFTQQNAGQGPARNLAVAHARGQFLTFMDADDILPANAYRHMVLSLRRSGSDFSVGSIRRVKNGRYTKVAWDVVHAQDRIGITIDDFPAALADVIACNRMFRRDFWLEQVGGFRGGVLYEDHVPMVVAYVRATKFDMLSKVTYYWRNREDLTSTGQQKHVLKNLTDRVEVKTEALAIVQEEASEAVRAAWVGRVIDTDFAAYIEHALRGSEEYRSILSGAFATYLAIATPAAMAHVRLQQKIRGYLASRGLWDQIEVAQRYFRDNAGMPPTRVVNGSVYAEEALAKILDVDLPVEILELNSNETSMQACLKHAEWVGDTALRLTGWCYVKSVDLSGRTPNLQAWLVNSADDRRVDLTVEQYSDAEATRWSGHHHTNYDTGAFGTIVDISELASDGGGVQDWRLFLRLTIGDVVREGTVQQGLWGSSARSTAIASKEVDTTGTVAVPRYDPSHGLTITVRSPQVIASALEPSFTDRTVRGRIATLGSDPFRPLFVRATDRATSAAVEVGVREDSDDSCTFTLQLPPAGEGGEGVAGDWELRAVDLQGQTRAVEWPATTPPRIDSAGSAPMYWQRSPRGYVRIVTDRPDVTVTRIDVEADSITVHVAAVALSGSALDSFRLADPKAEVPVSSRESTPHGRHTLRFTIEVSQFGLPARPLAPGSYAIQYTDDHGHVHNADLDPSLEATLPVDARTSCQNVRLATANLGQVRLRITPPLREDERGNWAQRQLRNAYQDAEETPEDAVLFQCYRGEVATDSQLAIHRELVRRGSGLTLYWGVTDYSTLVPEGAVPVVIGSREWYTTLARVQYLCNNVDFDGFFRKRPHQRYLQTFHGYPFKSMGRSFWAGKNFTEERISSELARRNAEWDAILVPEEFCVGFYRTEYAYTGEVYVKGYPRCDVLVAGDAHKIRAEVRDRLGIGPSQRAVLYAPTFRDSLTTRDFAAKRFAELDLDQLSAALGDDHVLLVRGHNNNQRESERVRGHARILDVTDYPDINELTHAADVAVLDYSSLRFDWALTGKPMLFFVPDLDVYFKGRPPLFEFTPTAPGPLLSTTADVAAAVTAIDDVAREYSAAIAAFNEEYNALNDGHATERVVDAFFGTR